MNDLIIKNESGEQYIKLSAFIANEMSPILLVPFDGVDVPVKLRVLNNVQIQACGEFSLIETITDKVLNSRKKLTNKQMLDYSDLQYEILKSALLSPSYDEIMALNEFDVLRIKAENEIESIREQINLLPDGPKKKRVKDELNALVMNTQYFLPADFVGTIMAYALQLEKTDIKLVSEDMLYSAAIKAKNGNDNPSDHLTGNFTDFNKEDINSRAWIIYYKKTVKDK